MTAPWQGRGRGDHRRGNSSNRFHQSLGGVSFCPFPSWPSFQSAGGLLPPILLTLDPIPLFILENKVGKLIFLGTTLTKSTQLKISTCSYHLVFLTSILIQSLGAGTVQYLFLSPRWVILHDWVGFLGHLSAQSNVVRQLPVVRKTPGLHW